MRRIVVAAALVGIVWNATLGLASAASAPPAKAARPAGRPDFTGRWVLDLARTDFGPAKTLPRARVDLIRHREPSLSIETMTVRSNGDTVRYPWRYATDGSETKNQMMGQEVTSIGEWRGDTLTFDSSAHVMMSEFRILDRWWLSPDRATLTVQRHNDSPMGKSEQRFVFVRKP
jgi:hypothetical protein